MSNLWHVWSVSTNRQKRIMKFLSELNCIDSFLYPMASKKYLTKNGEKSKDVPIYSNYVFIQYDHNPSTLSIIESCPWITGYVGTCSASEMLIVQDQNRKNYDDLVPIEQLSIGSVVKLVKTPFAGWDATIVGIDGDKLSVSITILGADRIIKCNIDDVNAK